MCIAYLASASWQHCLGIIYAVYVSYREFMIIFCKGNVAEKLGLGAL